MCKTMEMGGIEGMSEVASASICMAFTNEIRVEYLKAVTVISTEPLDIHN